MTSMTATGNSVLHDLSNSYVDTVKQAEKEQDPLGKEAFMEMLIAQLENQDPLNPMEGTEFTSQLAQYSALEQQYNSNDSLESILDVLKQEDSSEDNLLDYIGKEVSGESEVIPVKGGSAGAGYFTINQPADVLVSMFDASGSRVRDIYMGQKEAGSYEIAWDGTDNNGDEVKDGEYTFQVAAMNSEGAFVPAQTGLTGTVTGVTRTANGAYLQIGDRQIRPENITEVSLPADG